MNPSELNGEITDAFDRFLKENPDLSENVLEFVQRERHQCLAQVEDAAARWAADLAEARERKRDVLGPRLARLDAGDVILYRMFGREKLLASVTKDAWRIKRRIERSLRRDLDGVKGLSAVERERLDALTARLDDACDDTPDGRRRFLAACEKMTAHARRRQAVREAAATVGAEAPVSDLLERDDVDAAEALLVQERRRLDERARRQTEYDRLAHKWEATPPSAKRPSKEDLDALCAMVDAAKPRDFRKAAHAFEAKF